MDSINSAYPEDYALSLEIDELFPDICNEETRDVAEDESKPTFDEIPIAYTPDRKIFAGDLNFQITVNGYGEKKAKYLFSEKLNRIYVPMGTVFSMQFAWHHTELPMFVRAIPVFADPAQAEKPVTRCTEHLHAPDSKALPPEMAMNVLHSSRAPALPGVHYHRHGQWLSLLVEFSSETRSHAYKFVCKSSCPSGINRRLIDVIFQLEDALGNVYGRQVLGARSCSCTKRDKLRDEENHDKQRDDKDKPAKRPLPRDDLVNATKKIKMQTVVREDDVLPLSMEVVGLRTVIIGLSVMLENMEYEAGLKQDPAIREKYDSRIAQLRSKLDFYKSLRPVENDAQNNS